MEPGQGTAVPLRGVGAAGRPSRVVDEIITASPTMIHQDPPRPELLAIPTRRGQVHLMALPPEPRRQPSPHSAE